MKQVSINTDVYTKESITIDDNVFYFELKWSGLFWLFRLLYSDNKQVLLNTKVVPNFPLLTFSGRNMLTKVNNQVVNFRGDVVFSLLEDRDLQSDDFIKGKARMYIIEGDELDAFLAKNGKG